MKDRQGNTVKYQMTRQTTLKEDEEITLDSFERVAKLGKGAYGSVFIVKNKSSGKLYALKEVNRDDVRKRGKVQTIIRERDYLEEMGLCSYIINLECTFMDDDNFYFLMDYASKGTLDKILKTFPEMPLELIRVWLAELVLSLEAL